MKMIRPSFIGFIVVLFIAGCLMSQTHPRKTNLHPDDEIATVDVVAYSARTGKVLEPPTMSLFKSEEDDKDYSRAFRQGSAEGIPFGLYRMSAYLPGYVSSQRDVRVYQKHVTIIAGLGFGFESSIVSLKGLVTGLPASREKRSFVKLTGVYDDLSMESEITQSGEFQISGLLPGKYLLIVVTEEGIAASRLLTMPDDGPTVRIEIGSHYANNTSIVLRQNPIRHEKRLRCSRSSLAGEPDCQN